MRKEEKKHAGATTEHSKQISVNEKAINLSPNVSGKYPEPISDLSNRYLNEGN